MDTTRLARRNARARPEKCKRSRARPLPGRFRLRCFCRKGFAPGEPDIYHCPRGDKCQPRAKFRRASLRAHRFQSQSAKLIARNSRPPMPATGKVDTSFAVFHVKAGCGSHLRDRIEVEARRSPFEFTAEILQRQGIGTGRPIIARKTSKTKSAIAMSLNSVACGRFGQNWLADQKRNADARRLALTISECAGRRIAW